MSTRDTLTITDNRTGKTYELAITDDTIRALELRQIKVEASDFGMMTYDPAFTNTASCRSSITYIDGERGILKHRGYSIEDLADNCTFPEVAYLLFNGDLPNKDQLADFGTRVARAQTIPDNFRSMMSTFRYDAHPMGMLAASVAALGTFAPESKDVLDADIRRQHMIALTAKMPTLGAWAYRHIKELPFVDPDPERPYTENFLAMLKQAGASKYVADPDVVRAMDVLFILHADHEQNCSTNTMRAVGSSHADPYSAVSAACSALYGPLHGGANEAVLRMLRQIGTASAVKDFIQGVKEGTGGRLMGFGHRVYKNYDPRAKVIKKLADRVFEILGRTNPLLQVAQELEKHALEDDYFAKRKLYPNVDFYSGLIYEALEIPVSLFPVLFAIPRTVGWLAQWEEMLVDADQRIARPRQIYTGHVERKVVPLPQR